tara:strand:+ start:66 stop:332 length:267 start_codon:yes stop_codon:yes gene_type:complete
MKEFKGTKGEWEVREERGYDIDIINKNIDICFLGFSELNYETRLSNAKIIAAAPKLLAAAIKAIEECCDLIGTDAGNSLEKAINKALK